jgi:hypothetical protein
MDSAGAETAASESPLPPCPPAARSACPHPRTLVLSLL